MVPNNCNSIHIVDDSSENLQKMESLLTGLNQDASASKDPAEALKTIRDCAPEIILLDIDIPGLSASSFIASALELYSSNPPFIILMSENQSEDVFIDGLNAGANDIIRKPFNLNELKIKLSNVIKLIDHVKENEKLHEALQREKDVLQKERNLLAKYFSRDLIDAILNGEVSTEIGGEIRTVSILFCDLRNSTLIAKNTDPGQFSKFLNNLFTDITDIIYGEEGSVNKFLGDGILATFGCPRVIENDAYHCASVAVKIRKYLDNFNQFRPEFLSDHVEMGIGIARGDVFMGNIGSVNQIEYTVLGDPVNIAARLQYLTKKAGVGILMDGQIKEKLGGSAVSRRVRFKGIRGRMEGLDIYNLLSLN